MKLLNKLALGTWEAAQVILGVFIFAVIVVAVAWAIGVAGNSAWR